MKYTPPVKKASRTAFDARNSDASRLEGKKSRKYDLYQKALVYLARL